MLREGSDGHPSSTALTMIYLQITTFKSGAEGIQTPDLRRAGGRRRLVRRTTHEWELILLPYGWPERENYEAIRPLVLFDGPVAERASRGSSVQPKS